MAKKITGEDGKTYVEKKPIYKKWWFILLVVILVISVASNIGKKGDSKTENSATRSTENKTETKKEIIIPFVLSEKIKYEENALETAI